MLIKKHSLLLNESVKDWIQKGFLDTNNKSSDSSTNFEIKQIYHNETMSVADILNYDKEHSWKSKLHDDNGMFEDMFIVGINTSKEIFIWHCDLKYWDIFNVKELSKAPTWNDLTFKSFGWLFELLKK